MCLFGLSATSRTLFVLGLIAFYCAKAYEIDISDLCTNSETVIAPLLSNYEITIRVRGGIDRQCGLDFLQYSETITLTAGDTSTASNVTLPKSLDECLARDERVALFVSSGYEERARESLVYCWSGSFRASCDWQGFCDPPVAAETFSLVKKVQSGRRALLDIRLTDEESSFTVHIIQHCLNLNDVGSSCPGDFEYSCPSTQDAMHSRFECDRIPHCEKNPDTGIYPDENGCFSATSDSAPSSTSTETSSVRPPSSGGGDLLDKNKWRHAGITIGFVAMLLPFHITAYFCVRRASTRVKSWMFLAVSVVDGTGLIMMLFTNGVVQDFFIAMPITWFFVLLGIITHDCRNEPGSWSLTSIRRQPPLSPTASGRRESFSGFPAPAPSYFATMQLEGGGGGGGGGREGYDNPAVEFPPSYDDIVKEDIEMKSTELRRALGEQRRRSV